MSSSRTRRKGGQSADASAGAREKAKQPGGVPFMFRGFQKSQLAADESLPAAASKRVRQAWEEGGEARAFLQEQVEWCRHWIATGELEPKDALTAMRGLSKVLEQIEGRVDGAPVAVNVTLGDKPEVADGESPCGDPLAIH